MRFTRRGLEDVSREVMLESPSRAAERDGGRRVGREVRDPDCDHPQSEPPTPVRVEPPSVPVVDVVVLTQVGLYGARVIPNEPQKLRQFPAESNP